MDYEQLFEEPKLIGNFKFINMYIFIKLVYSETNNFLRVKKLLDIYHVKYVDYKSYTVYDF